MRLFDLAAALVAGFGILVIRADVIGADGVHVVPVHLLPFAHERLDERGHAHIAGLEVSQQQLVVDVAIARRLFNRDAVCGIRRETDAVVVSLNLFVALTVLDSFARDNVRKQSARRVVRIYVRVHFGGEMILVLLAVVDAGIGVASPDACHVFAILALGLASDGVGHTGCRHQIADVGGVDEHFPVIRVSAERGDGLDAPALHLHALPRRAVEQFVVNDLHAGIGDHLLEHFFPDVRLKTADEIRAV